MSGAPNGDQTVSNMIIDPEWASTNPGEAQGVLLGKQREDFQNRYRPLEEAAIAEFMKSPEEAAQRAGGVALESFQGLGGMTDRSLGRRGAVMTQDLQRAAGDARGLDQARAFGSATNLTRRAIGDRNIEGLGTMAGIGRGLQGGVNRDMGTASGLQSQRQQAGAAAKAGHKASMISTGLGVAGLAIAF